MNMYERHEEFGRWSLEMLKWLTNGWFLYSLYTNILFLVNFKLPFTWNVVLLTPKNKYQFWILIFYLFKVPTYSSILLFVVNLKFTFLCCLKCPTILLFKVHNLNLLCEQIVKPNVRLHLEHVYFIPIDMRSCLGKVFSLVLGLLWIDWTHYFAKWVGIDKDLPIGSLGLLINPTHLILL
jgi:hypothetical protein